MKQHKYTHLGTAPYALVGYFYDASVQDTNGAWHGGQHSCDHCGRPISHVFVCKSSDGKTFNLGSIHVEDLGDEGLTQAVKTKMSEVQKEARKAKYEATRQAQYEAEKQAEAEALTKVEAEFERVKSELQKRPHPNAYFASQGKTLLDYVTYFTRTIEDTFHPHYKLQVWYKHQVLSALREAVANI